MTGKYSLTAPFRQLLNSALTIVANARLQAWIRNYQCVNIFITFVAFGPIRRCIPLAERCACLGAWVHYAHHFKLDADSCLDLSLRMAPREHPRPSWQQDGNANIAYAVSRLGGALGG